MIAGRIDFTAAERAALDDRAVRRFLDAHAELTQAAAERYLAVDAQTSGGLLLAVPPGRLDQLLGKLKEEKTLTAAVIGSITAGESGIRVTRSG